LTSIAVLGAAVAAGVPREAFASTAETYGIGSGFSNKSPLTRISPSEKVSLLPSGRAPYFLDDHGLLLATAMGGGDNPTPQEGKIVSQPEDDNALEEVWKLVDKYYVNKVSNPNWSTVRDEYRPKFDQLVSRSASVEEQLNVVEAMVATLGDKYSRILTPSQYADIQKYDLLGVGVTLMPAGGRIVVGGPPIAGSASARAGLQAGDVILRVNGVSTAGKTALDIIDQISERPDAPTLTLSVLPREHRSDGKSTSADKNENEQLAYDVTLDRTLLPVRNPIQYKLSDDGSVGYVRISEFNSLVLSKLEEALTALRPTASQGLVLDLRQNTGGAFQSAVEIASLFLKDNRVAIYVVDNTDQTTPFKTSSKLLPPGAAVDPDVPLVIWMDGRTASASEVLASALHDNCRAVLAGSNSFGKGLIQAVYGLKNGGGLVLTVARYVTPRGASIQGSGIAPDVPGHVSPTVLGIPISSDTSSVDWTDVRRRLAQCQAPT
jgi:C-terminal peptidase prc